MVQPSETNGQSRVLWDGRFSSISLDWQRLVMLPAQAGYFIQAFASADALIDHAAESILRQIFSTHESQTLINHIHSIRGSASLDGMPICTILRDKSVISSELLERIRKFKSNRNLVLHTIEAEYKLLDYTEMVELKTQAEYDTRVRQSANECISNAFQIFTDLLAASARVHGREAEYLVSGLGTKKRKNKKNKRAV